MVQLLNETKDTLTIRKKEIAVRRGLIEHRFLKFFTDNPRTYSVVRSEGREPSQQEIQAQLQKYEHVKELIQDIQRNNGLIEPIVVLEGKWEVLEGNSRLAAYRHLANKDPIKWARMKCVVLPDSTSPGDIFALLGKYHIKGKKDWAPFEQAGFLYRHSREPNESLQGIAGELGIGPKDAQNLVDAYELMQSEEESDISRWSYYYEYVRSSKLKKLRKDVQGLDHAIAQEIKSGKMQSAQEFRDDLIKKVAVATKGDLNKFANGELSFKAVVARALRKGSADGSVLRLNKFRTWIVDPKTQSNLIELDGEALKKALFEVRRILSGLEKIKKMLD